MPSSPSRSRRLWIYALLLIPVLGILGLAIVAAWARSYLHGEDFRRLLSAKVSQGIKADGAFEKLDWTGSTFYSSGYTAQGWVGTKYQTVEASQVRATVNLHALWDRLWKVDSIEIERLRIVAGEGTVVREHIEPPKPQAAPQGPKRPGWLPTEVKIGRLTIADFGIDTTAAGLPGSVDGVSVNAEPDGVDWKISTTGGHIHRESWPDINMGDTKLRYAGRKLYITEAGLTAATGGTLQIDGQLTFDDPAATDLNLQVTALPAENVLPEDWRARLHGNLSGHFHVTRGHKDVIVEGPLELKDGHLEALPLLDQIALFTRTQRFRQLTLENVHGDIRHEGKLTEVKNFNAEAPGLLRLTGNFTIKKDKIDGDFLVGVTPGSLRYIPGSQEKIFTISQDGYLWTTMKVTGSLKSPHEDLSKRLAEAAGQEVIDQLEKNPSQIKDTLKDAAQSLLDLLGK